MNENEEMGMGNYKLEGLEDIGLGGMKNGKKGGMNNEDIDEIDGSKMRKKKKKSNKNGENKKKNEMKVKNELIGWIIGKGGKKIEEIRKISGEMIRI